MTTPTHDIAPISVNEHEAARITGYSVSSLQKLRVAGGGPPFINLGRRRVAYIVSDLAAWIASRPKHRTTSERDAKAAA